MVEMPWDGIRIAPPGPTPIGSWRVETGEHANRVARDEGITGYREEVMAIAEWNGTETAPRVLIITGTVVCPTCPVEVPFSLRSNWRDQDVHETKCPKCGKSVTLFLGLRESPARLFLVSASHVYKQGEPEKLTIRRIE
jgi:hypothetical protein